MAYSKNDPLAKRGRRRRASIEELLSTEKTYVDLLNKLVTHYANRLRSKTSILSADDYNILFPPDLHSILNLNQTFLNELSKRMNPETYSNWTTTIGDIVITFSPHFQRMPRYKILLEEVLKHTEVNHPDIAELNKALIKIKNVNDGINERIKEFEQRLKVQNIENRFYKKQSLVTPSRKYLKQGQLCKINGQNEQIWFLFALFNDCIVYASESMIGSKLTFVNLLKFNWKFSVNETLPSMNPHKIKHLFEIHSTKESFFVFAETRSEMNEWIESIKGAYIRYLSQGTVERMENMDAATLYIPDDFADICMINGCQSKFSFIFRRHHCNYCGFVICGNCVNAKRVKHKSKNEMVKVCNVCFENCVNKKKENVGLNVVDAVFENREHRISVFQQKGYAELLVTGYLRMFIDDLPESVVYFCHMAYGSIKKRG